MTTAKLSAIIWDWNGTLLDDVDYAIGCMNRVLSARGMPPLDRDRYRRIFTFPVEEYYLRLGFDLERESFATLSREFIDHYYSGLSEPVLYPGAMEIVDELVRLGLRQYILSAMEKGPLLKQLDHHRLVGRFTAIQGLDHINATGKMAEGELLLQRMQVDHGAILFVGDTRHDLEVARRLGLPAVILAHGHQEQNESLSAGGYLCQDLKKLRELLRVEYHLPLEAGPAGTR